MGDQLSETTGRASNTAEIHLQLGSDTALSLLVERLQRDRVALLIPFPIETQGLIWGLFDPIHHGAHTVLAGIQKGAIHAQNTITRDQASSISRSSRLDGDHEDAGIWIGR